MTRNNAITVILLLLAAACFAQPGTKTLHFRIVADYTTVPQAPESASVAGINVVNIANEKSAVSDGNGSFTIVAKADDLFVLQKEGFEYKRYQVEPEDLGKSEIIIKMIPKPIALNEVVVTKRAPSDDLIKRHKDHRKFTPAERKLYAARTGPVDILVNAITGRTAQLKKELSVEFKERLLARLEMVFNDDYYVQTLKIPADYIGDFKYYLIDDEDFVRALKDKNKTLMRFESARLAIAYNQLMSGENK